MNERYKKKKARLQVHRLKSTEPLQTGCLFMRVFDVGSLLTSSS